MVNARNIDLYSIYVCINGDMPTVNMVFDGVHLSVTCHYL